MKLLKIITASAIVSIISTTFQPLAASQPKETGVIKEKNDITKFLKLRLGNDKFKKPVITPVSGIYQTQFGTKYAYLTHDGRFLFIGNLIDLELGQNLTNLAKTNKPFPTSNIGKSSKNVNLKKHKMTDLLKTTLGSNNVSEPVQTPVDGIYQIQFGLNFAYLTEDGRYVFMANMVDLERGINLTTINKRKWVKAEMELFTTNDKAIFPSQGTEKAVLNIFTDTDCPFCKKLHQEVPELQKAGITVQYLPFPREGKQGSGYPTLKQVWCAEDKAKALTIGKGLESGSLPPGNCMDSQLVDKGFVLGNKVGVVGTPAIFKENGDQIQGYVPYEKLIQQVLGN